MTQQQTPLGRLVEEHRNSAKNAYSRQHLLTPREALAVVGLDIRRVIDRKIWEHFCSHLVLVEGIAPHSEGGTMWFKTRGSHRIEVTGRIFGYSRPNTVPLPDNVCLGYDPESVAVLRQTREARLRVREPNLADGLGLTIWKVGTDRLLSLGSDAAPAAAASTVTIAGKEYETISDELFDWPADNDERIKALYAKLVGSGTVTQLAPAYQLEGLGVQFSPIFEYDPAVPLFDPPIAQTEEEAMGMLPTDLGLLLEMKSHLLSAYRYRSYRVQRGYLKDLFRKNCTYCGRLFQTEDGRRRACDDHQRGTGQKPRAEYEAARKRKQRSGQHES